MFLHLLFFCSIWPFFKLLNSANNTFAVENLQIFFDNPMLVIYSKVDALCDYENANSRVNEWGKKNKKIEKLIFEDSHHVAHFKEHKKEYTEKVKQFLPVVINNLE